MDCVRRRGKVYNVVVTGPVDLVEVVGKSQLWRNFKTKTIRRPPPKDLALILLKSQDSNAMNP